MKKIESDSAQDEDTPHQKLRKLIEQHRPCESKEFYDFVDFTDEPPDEDIDAVGASARPGYGIESEWDDWLTPFSPMIAIDIPPTPAHPKPPRGNRRNRRSQRI